MWEHAEHHPVRYFNGVATLVNIRRRSGVGETVRKTSESVLGTTVPSLLSKALGRALRGRWSSLDSIVSVLVRTWQYFPEVFEAVLATLCSEIERNLDLSSDFLHYTVLVRL